MDYTPKRSRNLYMPHADSLYALSRSKVELFIECPCCFYTDRRLGTSRPPTPPFNLNLAVDLLLKKEIDQFRKSQKPHPLMEQYKKGVLPFAHPDMDKWRENFQGIRAVHHDTNFALTGAVDDVWIDGDELIIVDYKATSTDHNLTYKSPRYDSYKRQLDFYAYLFEQNHFKVSKEGLFVVCNGRRSEPGFHGALNFDIKLIKHKIDTSWVEDTLFDIFETLQAPVAPKPSETCNYCAYHKARSSV